MKQAAGQLVRGRFERREHSKAGIVDEGVDATERTERFADGHPNTLRIGHVERNYTQIVRTCVEEAVLRLTHRRNDIPAIVEEELCSCFAEARRAASNQSRFHPFSSPSEIRMETSCPRQDCL